MSKNKELIRNTIIIFLGKVSTQFLSFFLLPLYTAYLDSSEYGRIDLLLTYVTLVVPVVTLEIEMGTFRYLIDNRNDKQKENDIICSSISIVGILSLIIFFLYCIFINFFKFEYYYLFGLCIVAMIFSNLLMQISRGLGKNVNYSISCFLVGIANIIINIILIVFLHMGASSILISTALSNLIGIIYLSISLKIFKLVKSGTNSKMLQKEILKFSWPLVPNTISWWLINASDRTIVSLILGVSANGIYAISTKFSTIISSFLNIFNLSWTESASLHVNDEDCDEFFSNINDTILKLFSSICICLIAFMPILFKLFINEKYIAAYKYIPINILASYFSCIVSIYSAIYVAKKMTIQVASTSLMSAIINISVDLILINYIGLFAASISTAIAYLVMAIYRSIDLKKYVKIKYDVKNLMIILIGFIVCIFLYYQSQQIYDYLNYIFAILISIYINRNTIKVLFLRAKKYLK